MAPESDIYELAGAVRKRGLYARLGRAPSRDIGMAAPGMILATGRDAASFLQSQVTNEVEKLGFAEGNLSARVTRTGRLVQFFSLHRIPPDEPEEPPCFAILLERRAVPALIESFDEFLFADEVEFTDVSDAYSWSALQGHGWSEVAQAALDEPDLDWASLNPFAIRRLGPPASPGAFAISRSLTGDAGLILALPCSDLAAAETLHESIRAAARAAGMLELEDSQLSEVLEVLRIEAGQIRVGPDTDNRKSILPETGLEQQTVSYTKGCYLGQEVIARVRTYGSLPYGLRGLVFDPPGAADRVARQRVLSDLPGSGEDVTLEAGKTVGQFASRTFSPLQDRPVAFAYLDRDHRTPGTELRIQGLHEVHQAQVVLLPFYSAPDRDAKVRSLYDQAIRVFAEGREEEALGTMQEALKLDPGFSDAYEAIGIILGRSERFHEAIDFFKRLEELAPDEPIVNTNLSLYYMKIGERSTAESEAAKALQKDLARGSAGGSTNANAREMAAQRETNARRKKEMFSQVLELDPEDPIALFGLGNSLAALEEWEEAEYAYANACRFQGDNSALFLARAKALEKLGREEQALGVYREGMDVASRRGDLMPLKEMEQRMLLLQGSLENESEDHTQ